MIGFNRKALATACAFALVAGFNSAALASPILVDRGLPTANLNNAAGANRSNVAWVFGGKSSSDDANYWLVGDTFTNTSSQNWLIDLIRLWAVGPATTAVLYGGVGNSAVNVVSTGAVSGPVTYAGGNTYQGSSGGSIDMFQLDFAVNLALAPGETFNFFLDGTGGSYVIPFAHASNAARSGSPQQGADDSMLEVNVVNGAVVPGSIGPWSSQGYGWDKASDVNVQAFGQVPEPSSIALMGAALLGAAAARRRRKT